MDGEDLGISCEVVLFEVELDVARLNAGIREEFVSLEGLLLLDHPGDGVLSHVLALADQ